jgi:paraquat-inducible protein A
MMSSNPSTAINASLISCHLCQQLNHTVKLDKKSQALCSQCGSEMHSRKPNSISRTWALVITAFIFYIPANMLPVMTVISFGEGEPDTIMSGVVALIEGEMWALAFLVLFASFIVPLTKLIGLSYLLISIQVGSRWRPRERTQLYRVIEVVGRWSMLDIFMISILISLVKLGSIATIEPGVGGTFFAAVVVITMFAAMSFDPRLIWDSMEKKNR